MNPYNNIKSIKNNYVFAYTNLFLHYLFAHQPNLSAQMNSANAFSHTRATPIVYTYQHYEYNL